jgi:hypothetical protein
MVRSYIRSPPSTEPTLHRLRLLEGREEILEGSVGCIEFRERQL